MKKILSLALVLALTLCLTACGGSSGSGSSAADAGTSDADPADGGAAEDSGTVESTPAAEATLSEQILLEDSAIKVTVTGLDSNGLMGPEVKLLMENTGDAALTVQARNVSVNGYMVTASLSEDVAPGKKSNTSLLLLRSDLERCGIDTIADIAFSLHIFDSESWDTYLDTDLYQLTTSAAEGFAYAYDDSGTVLYEENGVKIVSKGISENDSLMGPSLLLYVENTTDAYITVQTRDVSVNGFMVTPLYSQEVTPGRHALSGVTFMSSELEENSITDITDVELSFHIFDTNSWDTVADTEAIPVTF